MRGGVDVLDEFMTRGRKTICVAVLPDGLTASPSGVFAATLFGVCSGSIEDVVKITLLIKDHDEKKLQYLVTKRRQVFGENPPASTLIPVSALALRSLDFEIDAIAVASR